VILDGSQYQRDRAAGAAAGTAVGLAIVLIGVEVAGAGGMLARFARFFGLTAPRAVPTLMRGPGGKMLGEAIAYLRTIPGNIRVAAFGQFVPQITKATNGQWNASMVKAINGTIFAGEGGEALVFDSLGNMFRGVLSNRAAFLWRDNAQIEIIFDLLRKL
jgi:hypothetical protein